MLIPYSFRKKIAHGELPDVWEYDLPKPLRVQIWHILSGAIGPSTDFWEDIHNTVAREHGLLALSTDHRGIVRCRDYLLETQSVDYVLDLVEIAFGLIDKELRKYTPYDRQMRKITQGAAQAIDELNERFRRAGIGYRFEAGQIVRIDSDLIHAEVVRPALQFLQGPGLGGPQEEFLKAHAHFRSGKLKEAIVCANNAFESTLKAICDQKSWHYESGATASELIKVVRRNGLLPDYLAKSFDQLAATLKSGLPKVRGEEGGHGQGSEPQETPLYVAAYALHLAAAKILFLAEAHKAKT